MSAERGWWKSEDGVTHAVPESEVVPGDVFDQPTSCGPEDSRRTSAQLVLLTTRITHKIYEGISPCLPFGSYDVVDSSFSGSMKVC